jgi:hypothetical protein
MQALQPLTPAEALRDLLHDAEEGLLGFDPISPLKPHLGHEFQRVYDRLRAAIATRYQLEPWRDADYILHKQADHLAAASEAFHVTGWSREDIRYSLQINLEPVAADPLTPMDGLLPWQPWQPWPPRFAAALFLAKLQELTRADHNDQEPGGISAVVRRERTINTLSDSFSCLPLVQRRQCRVPPTGSSLSDTYVRAEAHDGSQLVEGIVVDGERDTDGQWDFDANFTIFTTDEQVVVCHGYNCQVEVL